MKKKRRSRAISIVRLLREQQDFLEQKMRVERVDLEEARELFRSVAARLASLDRAFPDVQSAAKDLRYIAQFCETFWTRDPTKPITDDEELFAPHTAAAIVSRVPEEKQSKFWEFVESLMALIGKDRRA